MKKFLFLLLVGITTVVVLLFITNPGLLDKIWLWLIGFSGHIISLLKAAYNKIMDWLKTNQGKEWMAELESSKQTPSAQTNLAKGILEQITSENK